MKKIAGVLVLFTALILNSCSVDNCDVDCNSGPLSLSFELLDKTTGENLFTNGTFNQDDIKVLDLDNNNSGVSYDFISEDNLNIIILGPFGWEKEIANYNLKVNDLNIFTLNLDAEQKTEDCCSFVQLNDLQIVDATYELNLETGVYEVFIEL